MICVWVQTLGHICYREGNEVSTLLKSCKIKLFRSYIFITEVAILEQLCIVIS